MKRKADDSASVSGYILDVSIVKTSASGVKYFDGFVQTNKDEINRFVSFSPEKLDSFTTAHAMKSPVTISYAKITPKMGKKEIVVPRFGSLEVCQRRLNFNINSKGLDESTEATIDTIKTASMTCNLTAKVVKLDDTKNIITKYGQRKLQNAVIADKTGSIKVPLWGVKANSLDKDATYRFTNLCSQRFDNVLQMSTTSTTIIRKTDDMDIEFTEELPNMATIKGSVVVSNTSTSFKCLLCYKSLDVSDTNMEINITCKECFARQKLKNAMKTRFVKLMIKDENNEMHKFNVTSNLMTNFLTENDIENNTDEEIDNFFLDSQTVEITHNHDSDMAVEIKCE